MHLKRWITGIIALPILYLLVWVGGIVFYLLVTAASIITLWEYYRIVLSIDGPFPERLMAALGLVLAPAIVWAFYDGKMAAVLLILSVDLILAAVLSLPLFKDDPTAPARVAKQVLGLVYIPLFLSFLVLIRFSPDGVAWIFWPLLIVFAGDTGAFYAGTYLGRHKLCPWVSPKKTVEGSLGGLAANVAVALIYKALLLPDLATVPCILFALIIGVAGQAGDLFASEFKRSAGVKDSGRLLPGHGGFLDRLDALLFASPLAYLLKISIF